MRAQAAQSPAGGSTRGLSRSLFPSGSVCLRVVWIWGHEGVTGTEIVETLDSAPTPAFRWLPIRGPRLPWPPEAIPACRWCPLAQRTPRALPSSPTHVSDGHCQDQVTHTHSSPRQTSCSSKPNPGNSKWLNFMYWHLLRGSPHPIGLSTPQRFEQHWILKAVSTPST